MGGLTAGHVLEMLGTKEVGEEKGKDLGMEVEEGATGDKTKDFGTEDDVAVS